MIICFTGRRASGKTLALVRQLFHHLQQGETAYSNLQIDHPRHHTITSLEELYAIIPARVVVGLDVAEVWFWGTPQFQFVAWLRATGSVAYWTTQFPSMWDSDGPLVANTSLFLQCALDHEGNQITLTGSFDGQALWGRFDTVEMPEVLQPGS